MQQVGIRVPSVQSRPGQGIGKLSLGYCVMGK